MKEHQYITRLDETKCWRVRFREGSDPSGNHNIIKQRLFIDSQYGGEDKALAAAMSWRNWWAPRLGKPIKRHPKYKKKLEKYPLNNTGFVGVTKIIRKKERKQSVQHLFQVRWRETSKGERVARKRNFNYDRSDKNAEEITFKKACDFREEMNKKHYLT